MSGKRGLYTDKSPIISNRITAIFLALGVLLIIMVVACSRGGDNISSPSHSPDSPAVTLTHNGDTTVVQTNDKSTDTDDGSQRKDNETQREKETGASSAKDELKVLFEKGKDLSFKVSYSVVNKVSEKTTKGELSLYVMPGKTRTDSFQHTPDGDMKGENFFSDKEFISCSQQDGEWHCFNIPTGNNTQTNKEDQTDMNLDLEKQNEEFWNERSVLSLPDREITGVKAKCFKIIMTVPNIPNIDVKDYDNKSYEGCYSKEGIPLYTAIEGPGLSSVQEATSYSTKVSERDFEPPATPQSFEQMISGFGGGASS